MKTSSKGYLELNPFPNKRLIHSDPPVYMVDNFLSPNECKQIISMSDKKGIIFQFGDQKFPSAKITDWSYYSDFYNKKMRGEFSISINPFPKNKKKHCRDTTFILEAIKIINKP